MTGDWGAAVPNGRGRVRLAVFVCVLLANGAAFAQDTAQSPEGAPIAAPEPAAPDAASQPGFLGTLGRWLGDSKAKLNQGIKSTQDAIGGVGTAATGAAKDAASAAQQATGVVVGLPGTRIVGGRERCSVAANEAPDCVGAASALCRANGLASGRA